MYLEQQKSFEKAAEVYELGLHRSAHPKARLEESYKGFLSRMVRDNQSLYSFLLCRECNLREGMGGK